ncbi:hypothetical protein [[Mycobacterium] holstebronense]|uniref:Alanine and proline rich membrane protein n=1 Tax=[Mycobacterium] holstebronense TaxID=3064288 RepID=A0ABN9MV93_9MYCO|nr:hypothetical protein [Mycolicibacter sp. MU0102]CAJ1495837.1 hypothetical protein MU0102_000068 [Mycolicibacter sp. MU0102]
MTPPPWPTPPPAPPPRRSTAVFAALAALLSVAALVVAIISLTRSADASTPHYTAAQQADAKKRLCDSYKLAAHAEHIETNTPNNFALARLSATNGALILETAAADPALEPEYRDAARDLARAYQTLVAVATGKEGDDPALGAAINDANAKTRVMHELCGD